jgi:threonine dehydrogenase-like Zn-dependent dehydrogenase
VKANSWIGPNKVEVTDVPDPSILNSRDAIVKITATAICGSDLHLGPGWSRASSLGNVSGCRVRVPAHH